MKSKITLGLFLLAFFNIAIAQNIGHLSVFSEDGDKFYLVLNGERQNDIAQTNLRIEALNQPYYVAKIIFEDQTIAELNKSYLSIVDADGIYQDVTYRIKTDKKDIKKKKLNYFSMIPVQQGFIAAPNVYVMQYGEPRVVAGSVGSTTNVNTNVNSNVNTNLNMGINMGINMNMNVNVNESYSETTTQQQSGSSGAVAGVVRPIGCAESYAMSPSDFGSAVASVKEQGFDDTKLKIAKQIASSNCLNTNQISEICKTFGFEESKLEFAKFAYSHCTEPQNYFKLSNLFSFSSSVEELADYAEQHR